jgi:D-alanyl-D-alanine carboxypeptidase
MQRVHFHCVALDDERSDDYGLGIGIEDLNGRKMISHGGGFPGYITKTIADPTNEVVVSVLTNCLGGPAKAINTGIFSIIEYFKNNYKSAKPTHDATQLAGRYLSLWAMADIVIIGDNIVAAYPDSWQPFRAPDKLEYVQPATLKISKASSFGSEGELVTFTMKANSVAFMNYAGMTMWPVQVWERKLQVKKVISLKT